MEHRFQIVVITKDSLLLKNLDQHFSILWFKDIDDCFSYHLIHNTKAKLLILHGDMMKDHRMLQLRNIYEKIFIYCHLEQLEHIPAYLYDDFIIQPTSAKALFYKCKKVIQYIPNINTKANVLFLANHTLEEISMLPLNPSLVISKIIMYILQVLYQEELHTNRLYGILNDAVDLLSKMNLQFKLYIHKDVFLNLLSHHQQKTIYVILLTLMAEGLEYNDITVIKYETGVKILLSDADYLNKPNELNLFFFNFLKENNLHIIHESTIFMNNNYEAYIPIK
jgi:hypothetical protein